MINIYFSSYSISFLFKRARISLDNIRIIHIYYKIKNKILSIYFINQ